MKYTLTVVFEADEALSQAERADLYVQVAVVFGKRPKLRISNAEIKLRDDGNEFHWSPPGMPS